AIGWVLSMSEECQTASQRLNEVLDSHPEIADQPRARPLEHSRGRLEFRGVGFKYPKSDAWILRDLNVVVEPGETVGLVGRTGSGKTSLSYLVPRLYDVTEGSVLLDGIDVREILLRSLRSHIGFAFEDPILFSASVHENLVMGRPIVSDQELKRAIDVAQAGFVWDLPWGLETRVGEQGLTLSGGQRQRLALARAVLGRPRILVLDDPLSALDVHTEAAVVRGLERELQGTTALVVSHRPSTLALVDRVVLLDRAGLLVVVSEAAALAGPLLVRLGIVGGIPPLLPGGSGNPEALLAVVAALVAVAVVQAVTFRAFFFQSGRIGEDVVLSLRAR